jgi:type IV pilus assembly protein PilY1
MKLKKALSLFISFLSFLFLFYTVNSFARDTDLYTGGGTGVEPNILIIFDNSGSMDDEIDTEVEYDPNTTYPADPDYPTIVSTRVYENRYGNWFNPLRVFAETVDGVDCNKAKDFLNLYGGPYIGPTQSSWWGSGCTGSQKTLATGNWLNFYLTNGGIVGKAKKIDIAKKVIKDFLGTIEGVRVGLMIFNYSEGGKIQTYITELTDDARAGLIADVNAINASTWTPLAETLYEAGLYYQGKPSKFNSPINYSSTMPIQYYCQRNYVILMTDGISTEDRNSILGTAIGDQDGDKREPGMKNDPKYGSNGSDYLDDVAKYLYDNDLHSTYQGKQNVITYTIGFAIDPSDPDTTKAYSLLQRAATYGHGKFFIATSGSSLADSFTTILGEILSKTSSFVAPIVPVSKLERTMAGDNIYLAFFKPIQSRMWSGNIKKYGVQQTTDPTQSLQVGDILDVNGSKALDPKGEFYPDSRSYWTITSADGGEVEKGGVGEILRNRTTARKIYTYFGTNNDLTHSSNAFTKTNSSITFSLLGVSTAEDKDKVVDYVHGYDPYDDNGNGLTTDKRDWILGAFLHSRPFIIHYGPNPTDPSVIYAGSNDGMLHAFLDSNGEELWGFIPPSLLGRLKDLRNDSPGDYVDGSPRVYLSYDASGNLNQAILIFGLRRGGNKYYALDVTDPYTPKYLWKIDPDTMSQFAEMGESWSSPVIGKIASGTGYQWVAFIGGGYDEGQDDDINPPADDRGRAIYVVNVLTGALVWRYSYAENTAMTYSIPSDITKLDMDGDGKVDRLYVGDTNARMWRFDIGNADSFDPWTGRIIFQSNPDTSTKRKIFYAPDVTFEEGYESLFFGTGDREHPKETKETDRLYMVKDKSSGSTLKEQDLVDVTEYYSKTQEEQASMLNDIKTDSGWYAKLEDSGEKCLATPVVFQKTAYYTTFSPTFGIETDPCFVGEGTARLYAMKYDTGEAVFNLDVTNDVGGTVIKRSDRSMVIGTAIPSGVIVTIIRGTATGYVGVGGGVFSPQLKSTRSLVPLHWKLVF